MTFEETLVQVRELLAREGRVAYRILKRRFALNDEDLEDLKADLIDAKQVAIDEGGKVLVWTGGGAGKEAEKRGIGDSKTKLPSSSDVRLKTLDAIPTDGERRQLTVMFIDLVGSTTLSQQLDPEDYHARVVAYQTACQQVIARYEGHIAQYLGDGVLVYFGYPVAYEDAAVRAVHSGMEIVTAVRQLVYMPPLQVRIGIHTGPVVVGAIGAGEHTEHLALGETPNVAARVQGVAEPETVVVSAATERLLHGLFGCQDLGPLILKGIATPMTVYRVNGADAVPSRLEVAVGAGVTPLIGRDEEVGLLRRRWEQSKEGAGQVVVVTGEAGIGKSVLVESIRSTAVQNGGTRMTFRCSPYHQNSVFYPITEHLQRVLQFARDDTPADKLRKLEHLLGTYQFPHDETVPLFAALLSLPLPEDCYPALTLSPQQQKQRTYDALAAWLAEETERAPVLVVFEDMHWADASTLEMLKVMIDQTPTVRMLTVLTARPEFVPPWPLRSHVTSLVLNRLERLQVEVLVTHLTGGKTLPVDVMQHVVSKTDGVPLFVEELTKMLLGSDVLRPVNGHYELMGPLTQVAIPSTLQDSLMARLDRLAEGKTVAQIGAVLGREFAYEMLKALTTDAEATLQARLLQLVEAELLYQRGQPPRAKYMFKHALIQEAAYASLLRSTRQSYHQAIAQMFEGQFPDLITTQPELVAHHYTEAGLTAQALPYWVQAGQRAAQRSAHPEAIAHLRRSLEVLAILPETPERTQQELSLLATLGVSLTAVKGHAAPEVEQLYTRARAVCRQVGDTPQLFLVLWGLAAFYFVRGQTQTALELGEQLLSQGERQTEAGPRMLGHYHLATVLLLQGRLEDAVPHLKQVLSIYDSRAHRQLAHLYGFDLGVPSHALLGWALWLQGYPEQALQHEQIGVTLAQEGGHPFSLAYARLLLAFLQVFRQDAAAAHTHATAGIALSTEQGFALFAAYSTSAQGWAVTQHEQPETGIATMRQGLDGAAATGAELLRAFFLTVLAEATGNASQPEEGLRLLTEALQVVERTGERFYEAESYRLYGELMLKLGTRGGGQGPDFSSPQGVEREAEEYFLKAIDIAQQQRAKSLELRAVMSLARLCQQQDKRQKAHKLLADTYNWFTEGFKTKDLQEAKALLEKLSS